MPGWRASRCFTRCDPGTDAGWVPWFYATKLVWPDPLIFFYPRWTIRAGDVSLYIYPLLVIAAIAFAWWMRRRWGRGLYVALVCFVLMLFPALGFFDVYPMRFSFVADHFQYHASTALIVLIVAAAVLILRRSGSASRVAGPLILTGVLVVFAVRIHQRLDAYTDIEALWRDTIAQNPDAWLAHNNLGIELAKTGRVKEAVAHYHEAVRANPRYKQAYDNLGNALQSTGRIDEAIDAYKQALAIDPDYANAHFNLGAGLLSKGDASRAIRHFAQAIQNDPDLAKAHVQIANVMLSADRLDDAINRYEKALSIDPDLPGAHNNLAIAYTRQGRLTDAIHHYRALLKLEPDYAGGHHNLGYVLTLENRIDEAAKSLQRAIELQPDLSEAHFQLAELKMTRGQDSEAIEHYRRAIEASPDWHQPIQQLAWCLATTADDALRNPAEAVRLSVQATELVDDPDARMLDIQAAAYASAGRFEDAVRLAQRAISKAAEQQNTTLADAVRRRLRLYDNGQTYRRTGADDQRGDD